MRHIYIYDIPIYIYLASYVHHGKKHHGTHPNPWSPGTDHQISRLVPHNFQLTSQTSFNPLLDGDTGRVTGSHGPGRQKETATLKIAIQQKSYKNGNENYYPKNKHTKKQQLL